MTVTETIKPNAVCAKQIKFSYDTNTGQVFSIEFTGGCSGNTRAVGILCNGMTIDEIVEKLGNVKCGTRQTSCAAEFCKGLTRFKLTKLPTLLKQD